MLGWIKEAGFSSKISGDLVSETLPFSLLSLVQVVDSSGMLGAEGGSKSLEVEDEDCLCCDNIL